MRTLAVVLAVTTSFASLTAAAEPPGLAPVRTGYKNPRTALWLSLGTTAAGVALVIAGAEASGAGTGNSGPGEAAVALGAAAVLVGPSLGHFYAGHTWNAGLGVRLAGVAALVAGTAMVLSCIAGHEALPIGGGSPNGSTGFCGAAVPGGVLAVGGAAVYVGGSIYEIATSPAATERANRARAWPVAVSISAVRARDGMVPALALGGRF